MARVAAAPHVLPEPDYKNYDPRTDPHEVAFQKLLEESKALPEGQLVGALISWPRGDGRAWYRVTAERPLTLQHVPYGDAWTVEPALLRGLRKADVEEMISRDRRLRAVFGRPKEQA